MQQPASKIGYVSMLEPSMPKKKAKKAILQTGESSQGSLGIGDIYPLDNAPVSTLRILEADTAPIIFLSGGEDKKET